MRCRASWRAREICVGSGTLLAVQQDKYCPTFLGEGRTQYVRELQKLLEPFGIKKSCTDGWGAVA